MDIDKTRTQSVRATMRKITTAVLCLGIVFSSSPALAASRANVCKPGEFCAMAKLGKTTKDGTLTLVCKKVPSKGKSYYRWERG